MYGIDYADEFDMEIIDYFDTVIMVDFCLQPDKLMIKLLKSEKDIIWIDHHKTSFEIDNKHEWVNDIEGIRVENYPAACKLSWKYFYTNKEVPKTVDLVSSYDIWDLNKYPHNEVLLFQYGLRNIIDFNTTFNSITFKGYNKIFDDFFNRTIGNGNTKFIKNTIKIGKIVLDYVKKYNSKYMNKYGYTIDFEGYTCLVCNIGNGDSQIFESMITDEIDIMIPYCFNGKQYVTSMYSNKPEIDVSIIAKKYEGGGHKNAAGFQCEKLPF